MRKFIYVILVNLVRLLYFIPKIRWYADHPNKYSERDKYELLRQCVRIIEKTAFAKPISSGQENLPKEQSYIMFPNHQGKYDALGIMSQNDDICSFIIRDDLKWPLLLPEACALVNAKRMRRGSKRDALNVLHTIQEEIKAGKRYIIFPEGGYTDNKNNTTEFKAGTFKFATREKVPIVPVALIDTYKVLNNKKIFEKVTPQIHFLKPIYYDEYKDMTTPQIAELVKSRIDACIAEKTAPQTVTLS